MKNIAPDVAISLHIPGEMARERIMTCNQGRGRCCKVKGGLDSAGHQPDPEENFREGKVGRNNSTKIDNPIFGVLHPFIIESMKELFDRI